MNYSHVLLTLKISFKVHWKTGEKRSPVDTLKKKNLMVRMGKILSTVDAFLNDTFWPKLETIKLQTLAFWPFSKNEGCLSLPYIQNKEFGNYQIVQMYRNGQIKWQILLFSRSSPTLLIDLYDCILCYNYYHKFYVFYIVCLVIIITIVHYVLLCYLW